MKLLQLFVLLFFLLACEKESENCFDIHMTLRSEVVYDQNLITVYHANDIEYATYNLSVVDSVEFVKLIGLCNFGNGYAVAKFRNDTSFREIRFCEIVNHNPITNFFLIDIYHDSIHLESGYNAWP